MSYNSGEIFKVGNRVGCEYEGLRVNQEGESGSDDTEGARLV